jgi:hypothetical protein
MGMGFPQMYLQVLVDASPPSRPRVPLSPMLLSSVLLSRMLLSSTLLSSMPLSSMLLSRMPASVTLPLAPPPLSARFGDASSPPPAAWAIPPQPLTSPRAVINVTRTVSTQVCLRMTGHRS